jgi:phosphatidylserine/phosphatidylglycerophosphate/cardiolipin synthase-like enzyme
MKRFAVAVALFALPAFAAEIHFAPREDLEAIDVALIGEAQSRLDIAVYGFTSAPVMNALAEAGLRGVHVRIYRDRSQVRLHGAVAEALETLEGTPNVEIRTKKPGPIMHLKAYAVDGKLLRTGSANFTRSGLRRQDNDLVIDRDAADVAGFEADFNDMWER